MDVFAEGLHFPTSLVFDPDGVAYVAESGLGFGGGPRDARVLRIAPGEPPTCLFAGLRAPINGLTLAGDQLYVAEGGAPGRISRLGLDGSFTTIVDELPGGGNYHTNMVAVGDDGWLYFGQGAMTNSAIVGIDAIEVGRPGPPPPCDRPGMSVVLTGADATTPNPDDPDGPPITTGAFAAYGTAHPAGTRLPAALPCTAGIMRCRPDGSKLATVAWGLRNPYGLRFAPDGRLLALDLGMNDRGARPVGGAPSCLFEIREGAFYGWPDFVDGDPVTDPRYVSQRGAPPRFVLANHAELPPPQRSLVRFESRAAAVKFAVCPSGPHAGQLFVALFGDKRPFTAPPGPAAGRAVVRVELDGDGETIHPVVAEPLHRPIDVCFNPSDGRLYIVDFGEFEVRVTAQADAVAATGKIWRA